MVRESYQQQLEGLIDSIDEMGAKVREGLSMGLQALRDDDPEIGRSLDDWDDAVDQMNLDVERQCTDLLALQQPVAIDLRQIVSAFKIVTDLERVADLAVNLGEYSLASEAFVLVPKEKLLGLGRFADQMLQQSLEAFRAQDTEQARSVIGEDREMDQRCWDLRTEVLTEIIKSASERQTSQEAHEIASNIITVLWSIRDLERVADHAVNICARTIYWLEADPKFI